MSQDSIGPGAERTSDDEPTCVHCGGEADMYTSGEHICDACDDEMEGR
jgi:hypothetical protein